MSPGGWSTHAVRSHRGWGFGDPGVRAPMGQVSPFGCLWGRRGRVLVGWKPSMRRVLGGEFGGACTWGGHHSGETEAGRRGGPQGPCWTPQEQETLPSPPPPRASVSPVAKQHREHCEKGERGGGVPSSTRRL